MTEPLLKLVEPGREERAARVETIPPRSWLSRVVTKERPGVETTSQHTLSQAASRRSVDSTEAP